MSQHSNQRVIPPQPKRPLRSKILILLSYGASAAILFWAFWLPFQAVTSDDGGVLSHQPDLADQVQVRRTNAESIRAEAVAIDRQFMQMHRAKVAARTSHKPGELETQQWWQHRAAKTRREIERLGEPKPGTVEWHYRQELIESLQSDSPL